MSSSPFSCPRRDPRFVLTEVAEDTLADFHGETGGHALERTGEEAVLEGVALHDTDAFAGRIEVVGHVCLHRAPFAFEFAQSGIVAGRAAEIVVPVARMHRVLDGLPEERIQCRQLAPRFVDALILGVRRAVVAQHQKRRDSGAIMFSQIEHRLCARSRSLENAREQLARLWRNSVTEPVAHVQIVERIQIARLAAEANGDAVLDALRNGLAYAGA